jgi:YD repeat-containing protein
MIELLRSGGAGSMRARLESPRASYATPATPSRTTRAPRRRQLPTTTVMRLCPGQPAYISLIRRRRRPIVCRAPSPSEIAPKNPDPLRQRFCLPVGPSISASTYTWNARNQLVAITGASVAASFTYDALGRRQRKTIDAVSTEFLYDGLTPIQEREGPNLVATLLTGLGVDEYVTRTDASGPRHLLADALGSTVALTDDTGAVATAFTYEPFGATTLTGAPPTTPSTTRAARTTAPA